MIEVRMKHLRVFILRLAGLFGSVNRPVSSAGVTLAERINNSSSA
jgi:hypothetical protein